MQDDLIKQRLSELPKPERPQDYKPGREWAEVFRKIRHLEPKHATGRRFNRD